jgi:hypothetical protein
MLPMMITSAVQASVSVKRINKFMRSDELEPGLVKRTALAPHTKDAVQVTGGSFRWESSASAVAKPETNGAASSKTNGASTTTAADESKENGGEETVKLLNGTTAAGTNESPREVFSLKDINIRRV